MVFLFVPTMFNPILKFLNQNTEVESVFVSLTWKALEAQLASKSPIIQTPEVKMYDWIYEDTQRFLVLVNESKNKVTVHLDQEPRYWESDKSNWFTNQYITPSLESKNEIYVYKILEIDYQTNELKHITPSWNDFATFTVAVLNKPDTDHIKAINELSTIWVYNQNPKFAELTTKHLKKINKLLPDTANSKNTAFDFNDFDNLIWRNEDGCLLFQDQNVWQLIKPMSDDFTSFEVYSASQYQCLGKFDNFMSKISSNQIKPQIVLEKNIWKELDETWMYIFGLNNEFGAKALIDAIPKPNRNENI